MTWREWVRLVAFVAGLLGAAVLSGVIADRMILGQVENSAPQRLAAAMGGLFAGGLVFSPG